MLVGFTIGEDNFVSWPDFNKILLDLETFGRYVADGTILAISTSWPWRAKKLQEKV